MTKNNATILEYGTQPPHRRLRRWAKRLALAALVLACLYAAPIAWLYWGWRQEQPAREMVARVGGAYIREYVGPAFLHELFPARLLWIRERGVDIDLSRASPTEEDIRILNRLTRLKVLYLGRQTTEGGIARLKELTSLKWLVLDGVPVTDDGLSQLAGLTGLQRLFLDETPITDGGLAHLRGLADLKVLWLEHTRVGDTGLMQLKGLTKLELLDLGGTRVTDAGLAHLKGLARLQTLRLFNTQVTDGGLAHLAGLTELQELDLDSTRITDQGLAQLMRLTKLRQLGLKFTQVTAEGVARLQKALPQCQIDWWPPATGPAAH